MIDFMNRAVQRAKKTMRLDIGGPFGACVVKDGKIISVASNTVLKDNDPTCHAEMNAIRKACKKLKTYDLSGCELYATGYPCPMCLSAIIWANIKTVYYGTDLRSAEKIGFRDDFIYNYIKGKNLKTLSLKQVDHPQDCQKLFDEYEKLKKTIY